MKPFTAQDFVQKFTELDQALEASNKELAGLYERVKLAHAEYVAAKSRLDAACAEREQKRQELADLEMSGPMRSKVIN
jgi:hypothetical protein